MSFSYDNYGNLKQSKMFLYSSRTKPIGTIVGATNIKLEQNFHKLFELNFKVYKNINNEETEFYDKIIKNKLIELQYINWFQILSAVEKYDNTSKETYKEVKCCPLENSLIYRKVHDINGVFGLWDISDPSKSLLHIISTECGWSIGHVSNSLLSKYRTFNINSMEIYNLMTTKIQDSFGCIFQFDSYTKSINAYLLSELNDLTDIVISKKNILKEYIKDDSENAIITKMIVKGGDDGNGNQIDIRAVNFGRNYLINLDYYMTSEWVSQSLVDSYNAYRTACDTARNSYNSTLSTIKTKNAELTVLKASLKDLESLQNAQYIVWQPLAQKYNGTPPIGNSDYTIYINALNLYNSYFTQINSKKSEIIVKQNEIISLQSTLDFISNSIDESNYFTSIQIAEMNNFIVEGEDFEDSTYVITSETPDEEALEIKSELMQSADNDLTIKSKPNYTFSIKASNLFTVQDNKDELISYLDWRNKFKIGSLITLFINNMWMTVRLMSIIIDFDNPDDIELKFSTKNRIDDELIQLAEIIADSSRAASAITLKSLGYDAASKQTSQVREFINGSLNATLNAFKSNDNQDMLFDGFGLHGRKWLPDQNKFDDRQSWINNNGILITSDGWQTASTALGLIVAPDGNSYYGLATDVIVGDLIMGSRLKITNTSGTYTWNNNGMIASATVGINTYSVGINPSTPSEIINVKVNGTKQLYIDVATNQLIFNGKLSSTAINAQMINALNITAGSVSVNWVYAGSISANQINAGTISGDFINGGTISGVKFVTTGNTYATTITDGYIDSAYIKVNNLSVITYASIGNDISFDGNTGAISCVSINAGAPITSINLQSMFTNLGISVGNATNATNATNASIAIDSYGSLGLKASIYGSNVVYISPNDNFRPTSNGGASCGTSTGKWSSVWAVNGVIQTSDERLKTNIKRLDEDARFLAFAKMIVPYTFKMIEGTSGRNHVGFIAQRIEEAMTKCGITDMEFAGLIKAPVYADKIKDEFGNDIGEYDTTSEIIDYSYNLRYEEFIPLIFLWLSKLEIG